MLRVSRFWNTEMISLIKAFFYLLFCWIKSFEVVMNSFAIGIVMDRGAWSDVSRQSEWMECWFNSIEPHLRNIRSMVELASSTVSKYLVGQGLVDVKRANCQNHWWWTLFLFSFHFILFFSFFLFLEQLGSGFISHAVTSVTSWWHSHKTDHRTWKKGVEGSRIKWHYITWTTHVSLMSYIWSFRVGCTVVSTDHG